MYMNERERERERERETERERKRKDERRTMQLIHHLPLRCCIQVRNYRLFRCDLCSGE